VFNLPSEEDIKIGSIPKPIRVLVIKETPEEWRLWNAFTSMLSRHNDLALRVYATILEHGDSISSRDLVTIVDAPLYSVRSALKDLYDLGLVSRVRVERGHLTFDHWSVKEKILGVLRLIPEQYFGGGYQSQLKKKEK
jgi:predicted DNA-binding transcriptional regulator